MNHTLKGVSMLAVLFTVVLIALSRRYKRRITYRRLQAALELAILEKGLSLTRCEMVGTRLVAWDHTSQLLLIVEGGDTAPLMIDLKTADKCFLIKKTDVQAVKTIRLLFVTKDNRKVYDLVLYQQYQDRAGSERQIEAQGQDWKELLNSHLVK